MTDFQDLLEVLPKDVADRVYKKYEEDRAEFIQVVKDMTPNKGPEYWANRSCTKCYGRGIIGVRVSHPPKPLPCKCVDKAYKRFVIDVRKFYLALQKEMGHGKTIPEEKAD